MNPDDSHMIAAHAMLLTLEGSLSNAEGSGRFRFDPSAPEVVDRASALAALAALPKPVCCGISLTDGVPTVSWWNIAAIDQTDSRAREFSLLDRAPVGRVLLIAAGAELMIPAEALKIWRRDYRIGSPYTMSADAPTEEEQAEDVVWVLRVYEGADVTELEEPMLDLLQELRLHLQNEP